MKKIVITAGPTRENIDPVRFITNRSTGKMGYALAFEASKNHNVTLITGPVNLTPPENCHVINVESAQEMYEAVMKSLQDADVLIMAAAVADYTPVLCQNQKMKKNDGNLFLELKRTKDILAEASKIKDEKIFIGFAAETQNLLENAKSKLLRKKLDWIVANDVSRSDIGFGADENMVTLISQEKTIELPKMTKQQVACAILDLIQ